MLDYALVAGIVLYLVMVRVSAVVALHPLWLATVTVGGGAVVLLVIRWITYGGKDVVLLDSALIITILAQWVAAAMVFYKLQASDETYGAWFFWGAVGGIVVFIAVPQLVRLLL